MLERYLAVVYIQQPLIADGDTMRITAQIVDNVLWTAEWSFGVNNPFALPERSRQIPECLGLCQFGEGTLERQPLLVERLLKCFEE